MFFFYISQVASYQANPQLNHIHKQRKFLCKPCTCNAIFRPIDRRGLFTYLGIMTTLDLLSKVGWPKFWKCFFFNGLLVQNVVWYYFVDCSKHSNFFFVISLLFVIFFVHRKLEVFRKYSMHCSYICSLTKLFFVEIQLYEPFVWFFTSTLSLNTLIQSTIFWLVVVQSVLFFTCNLHR